MKDDLTRRHRRGRVRLLAALLLAALTQASAAQAPVDGELRIACASNFYPTLERLAALFKEDHPRVELEVISGSSGHLYQQIRHGAPYHLFLSADRDYPAALHRQTGSGEPRTYALGRLALWGPRGLGLNEQRRYTVAIANPATAPYGRAGEAALSEYRRQRPARRWRAVVAANISQAAQLVDSGNADLGLVALSLILERRGDYQLVPTAWYQPLVQQGVVVESGNPLAEAFMTFLLSDPAGRVIRDAGYALPAHGERGGGGDGLDR